MPWASEPAAQPPTWGNQPTKQREGTQSIQALQLPTQTARPLHIPCSVSDMQACSAMLLPQRNVHQGDTVETACLSPQGTHLLDPWQVEARNAAQGGLTT